MRLTVAFAAYLAQKFGDPLLVFHIQRAWGRRPKPPWDAIDSIFHHRPFHAVSFGLSLAALVFAIVWMIRRKYRPSYIALGLLHLTYMSTSGLVEGLPRFVSVV